MYTKLLSSVWTSTEFKVFQTEFFVLIQIPIVASQNIALWDAEVIEASYSTSRYLDKLFNIDKTYFDGMVNHIFGYQCYAYKSAIHSFIISSICYGPV